MLQKKTKSESIIGLYDKSLKVEIFDYIDQKVEEKFKELQENETKSNTLLDAKEVCEKYKISKSSLERYIKEGLKFNSKSKNYKRLFKQKDLEIWFDNKKSKKKYRHNG